MAQNENEFINLPGLNKNHMNRPNNAYELFSCCETMSNMSKLHTVFSNSICFVLFDLFLESQRDSVTADVLSRFLHITTSN